MSEAIVVALITGAVSLIGTVAGTVANRKSTNNAMQRQTDLTLYRIDQLEQKVQAHNNLIDRTYHLEEHAKVCDEKFKVANHRLDDLERREHE